MPERVHIGGHQAEHGLLLVAFGGRIGGRDLQHRLGLGPGVGPEREHLPDRVGSVEKEAAEHLVVDPDLLMPGDQRAPARPVQVQQVGRV